MDSDVTIYNSIECGDNNILEFEGGTINGFVSENILYLKGNHTCIVAPFTKIFNGFLKVIGSWNIEYSTPQWFGLSVFSRIEDVSVRTPENISFADATLIRAGNYSSVGAIQQAIDMFNVDETGIASNGGNVFISEGIYLITRPIFLRAGVNLKGVQGNVGIHKTGLDYTLNTGTRLYRSKHFTNNGSDNSIAAMLNYNIDRENTSTWEWPYARNYNHISDLIFMNKYNGEEWTNIPGAIKIGAGALIDNILFHHIPVAVKSLIGHYIDSKCVKNCTYNNYIMPRSLTQPADNELPFAFDLRGLGDSLVFEHNVVSGPTLENKLENVQGSSRIITQTDILDSGRYNHGIAIFECGGAFISNNIINVDIQVEDSKGIRISNNHMEYGPQIRMSKSVVDVVDNYIEKGKRPSILTWNDTYGSYTVARLVNNQITCRSLRHLGYLPSAAVGTEYYAPSWVGDIIAQYCPYDIMISEYSNIQIENMYRYWLSGVGMGTINPTGIIIAKPTVTDSSVDYNLPEMLDDFNNHSYALSNSSRIIGWKVVARNFTVPSANNKMVADNMSNTNDIWIGQSGEYQYFFQIPWDQRRKIARCDNSI